MRRQVNVGQGPRKIINASYSRYLWHLRLHARNESMAKWQSSLLRERKTWRKPFVGALPPSAESNSRCRNAIPYALHPFRAMTRQTATNLQKLLDHMKRHVAGQRAAGRGHRDIAGCCARRDRGAYVRIGNHREARRSPVERDAGGSGESLPKDAEGLPSLRRVP